jgi:hypothetical protein
MKVGKFKFLLAVIESFFGLKLLLLSQNLQLVNNLITNLNFEMVTCQFESFIPPNFHLCDH